MALLNGYCEEPDRKRMEPSLEKAPEAGKASGPETSDPAKKYGPSRVLNSWARDLVFSIIVSSFIILFVYQPVKVEGGSMEPGLEDQERIFINKLVYRWEDIGRGDIVVFRYPRDPRKSFIKRVIGLPGDRVRISFGHVYVNGKLVAEPYVPDEFLDTKSYPESVIPANGYFVLGDHRSMSNDSRDFGAVTRSYIYGKAVFGYWPMEKVGILR
ncbi:MAG TPA: signal peptidase I [Candidatus Angelobacter sp.]|nr:signal peptidase I [Candidatus Angelobacter sp.]